MCVFEVLLPALACSSVRDGETASSEESLEEDHVENHPLPTEGPALWSNQYAAWYEFMPYLTWNHLLVEVLRVVTVSLTDLSESSY